MVIRFVWVHGLPIWDATSSSVDNSLEGVLIIEDNCCFCNTAAFTLATEEKNVDLFFVSFRNGLYEVPFVVLADHETRSIVITIRGSCSLVDLVTDLCLGGSSSTTAIQLFFFFSLALVQRSRGAMQRLRIKVAAELDACTKAKYEILIRGIFRIFFSPSWESGPLSGNGAVTDRANLITDGPNPNGSYGAAGNVAPNTAAIVTMVTEERLASRVELFAPGKLLYVAEDESLEEGITSQWIDPK
ncbi:hypothetical protein TELCIR_04879 [Teladorsagia circumcincta]|uniref:Uncharacterized protein n=1 Tax=Teladorsagia circumcincta TaxID=45464 RepID=A0A2G9USB5_TELCI|nr:hypothetical protein TELCIR_04879 [Teladorsagia circumcincta]